MKRRCDIGRIAAASTTINSYHFGGTLADIPAEHWALLDTCVPYYETDECILTHANYRADLPMAEQPEFTLRWELFDPAKEQPHISGKTVVVGHTEQKNAEILDLGFAMCIDTVCCKYGWLTAIDVSSLEVWQANRWGMLRESEETSHRHQPQGVVAAGRGSVIPPATRLRCVAPTQINMQTGQAP